jgi:hypothetical protein
MDRKKNNLFRSMKIAKVLFPLKIVTASSEKRSGEEGRAAQFYAPRMCLRCFPPGGVFGIAEREGDGGIEFHKSNGVQQGRGGGPQDGSRPVGGRALLPDHHVRGDSYTKIRVDRSRGAGQRRSPATRPWNNRINPS